MEHLNNRNGKISLFLRKVAKVLVCLYVCVGGLLGFLIMYALLLFCVSLAHMEMVKSLGVEEGLETEFC